VAPSETPAGGVSLSTEPVSSGGSAPSTPESAAAPASEAQSSGDVAPAGTAPEYGKPGGGSWLFFGGVGLLLVGVVLLLVWRRQG